MACTVNDDSTPGGGVERRNEPSGAFSPRPAFTRRSVVDGTLAAAVWSGMGGAALAAAEALGDATRCTSGADPADDGVDDDVDGAVPARGRATASARLEGVA